jgi:hypothetical protein
MPDHAVTGRVGKPYRPWTAKDAREAVRLRRLGWDYLQIGGALGRTRHAVKAVVVREAPEVVRPRLDPARYRGRLRRLHAAGYSDPEIASRLGLRPRSVTHLRRAMGLPSNKGSARQRARVGRRTRAVVARAGKRTFQQIQAEVWAARAAAAGWPGARTPPEVRVLDLLAGGPRTLAEVVAGSGLRSPCWTNSLLARLRRRGLVARRDRYRAGVRQAARLPSLYELAPGVGRHRPTRDRREDGPLPGVNRVRAPEVRRVGR